MSKKQAPLQPSLVGEEQKGCVLLFRLCSLSPQYLCRLFLLSHHPHSVSRTIPLFGVGVGGCNGDVVVRNNPSGKVDAPVKVVLLDHQRMAWVAPGEIHGGEWYPAH